MNLLEKLSRRDQLMHIIEDNYGVIEIDEESELEHLDAMIQDDVEGYSSLITEKEFAKRIEKLKEIKKEIDNEIKYMEKKEANIKNILAVFLEKNGAYKISHMGLTKYLTVGYTIRKEIDNSLVEDKYGKYIITIDYDVWKKLYSQLDALGIDYKIERKILLEDLPADHQSINKKLNPQIKLVKNI